ncbi:MAG: fibronectin type III domain-containing protein [Planctomycetota bacterium]
MAHNAIPTSLGELISFAEQIAGGLGRAGAELGIVHNDEAAFRADLLFFMTAVDEYRQAQAAKVLLTKAQTEADSDGKKFILTARNVISTFLGNDWTQAWEPTGFPNQSLAIPTMMAERQALLDSLGRYLAMHPTQEVAALNVTASRANTLFNALSDARSAVHAGLAFSGQKLEIKTDAERRLKKRLSDTIAELGIKLGPLDPRWQYFGLNCPGAKSIPDVPDAPALTNAGPGRVFATWTAAARALRYHIWTQIVGVDSDFVNFMTASDTEALLQNLPSGATLNVRLTAVNDAGESQPSDASQIVVE